MSKTTNKFSPEIRSRAVRLVLDHEKDHPSRWAAISSVATKIGCLAQTLNEWVKKAEVDNGGWVGIPTDVQEKLKAQEREIRKLRQVNERRLMRGMDLRGAIRGKSVKTTLQDKSLPCPLDHVNRQFRAERPDML